MAQEKVTKGPSDVQGMLKQQAAIALNQRVTVVLKNHDTGEEVETGVNPMFIIKLMT